MAVNLKTSWQWIELGMLGTCTGSSIYKSNRQFDLVKDALKNFYKLKYFMTSTSALLKQGLCKIKMKKKLTNIASNTIYINNNNEFPRLYPPCKIKEKPVV